MSPKSKYYTGAICQHHPDLAGQRYISTGHCVACAKERTAAYQARRREAAIQAQLKAEAV